MVPNISAFLQTTLAAEANLAEGEIYLKSRQEERKFSDINEQELEFRKQARTLQCLCC